MARITNHVTVARDGLHNAFTDLQYWQGCYWVSYRKGAAHTSMDGEAAVSVSADRKRFREAAKLKAPGDGRDPKLLPIDDTQMAMYFPAWTHGIGRFELQQYISFTRNGYDWSPPQPILEGQRWLWRIRKHDGRYWALVQDLRTPPPAHKKILHNLDVIVSDDLLHWEEHARIGTNEQALCESDIHWQPDGQAQVVARSATVKDTGSNDFFATANPPYTDWQVSEMSVRCHAAIFLEHEGELYVAGRRFPWLEGERTFPFDDASLGIFRVVGRDLELVLNIPATGDCSYPGLIKDPQGRICISYYSQHAYHLGVVPSPPPSKPERFQSIPVNDIYFAEIELP